MEQNFKPGDYVYFIDCYDNNQEGTIEDIFYFPNHSTSPNDYYIVHTKYGVMTIIGNNIFKTKEDREQSRTKRYYEKIQEYCKDINDIKDLVFFMLDHNVAPAGEYTDWEAREAARIKIHQFGIDLT